MIAAIQVRLLTLCENRIDNSAVFTPRYLDHSYYRNFSFSTPTCHDTRPIIIAFRCFAEHSYFVFVEPQVRVFCGFEFQRMKSDAAYWGALSAVNQLERDIYLRSFKLTTGHS